MSEQRQAPTLTKVPADDRTEPTVSAAAVRSALELSGHQLSELTSGLAIDVGPRPNYPRYHSPDLTRMTVVQASRELRAPLDVALRAAVDYRSQIESGAGWLIYSPDSDDWAVGYVTSGTEALRWLRLTGGRAHLLDLAALAEIAGRLWRDARAGS